MPPEDLTPVVNERPQEVSWIINGYALVLIYKLYLIDMVFLTHGHYDKLSTNVSLLILILNFVINAGTYQGLRLRKPWAVVLFLVLTLESVNSSMNDDIGIIGFIQIIYCIAALYFIFRRPTVKDYFLPKKPLQNPPS